MKNSLLKGAFTLSVAGLIAKILGALYRIPLTNIIGAQGIGLYQTSFPVYCILLTFSSSGVPNSLAKLISQGYDGKDTLKKSLKIFCLLGVSGSLLTFVFGKKLAAFQGEKGAYLGYMLLSPSVLFTSALSCFRGYFQGLGNMKPTAFSQVAEQVVKLVFGLTLAYIFRENVFLAAGLCSLSVTLSEVFALALVYFLYKRSKPNGETGRAISKKIIVKTVVPVTLTAVLIPLARTLDSFMIINILKSYTPYATKLYGLYSGGVESVIGVPVALCYGIACAAIPRVSKLISCNENAESEIKKSLLYTLISGLICSLTVFFGAFALVNVAYFGLAAEEKRLLIGLIKTACPTVLGLALIQTTNALFIAQGKLYTPCVTLGLAVLFKTAFSLCFLRVQSVSVFATALSDVIAFSLCAFANVVIIIKSLERKAGLLRVSRGSG